MKTDPVLTVVCCHCGRVRTRERGWADPSSLPPETSVSHGICPDCLAAHYPGIDALGPGRAGEEMVSPHPV